MDQRFAVTRDEINGIQMDLKHLQHTQANHAERLFRLERRQADDAAIKAAWSPFPGVLATTPQHGMVFSFLFFFRTGVSGLVLFFICIAWQLTSDVV